MSVLVTGGTGYIGSHTVVELIRAGYDVIIADNLSNSKICVLDRIEQITGKRPVFEKTELCNPEEVETLFSKYPEIDSVIHFAGLKAVGESVRIPLDYYQNNLFSTLMVCQAMKRHGVHKFVFSSSATVYGAPKTLPISEDAPLTVSSPYGRTKLMIEELLWDWCQSDPDISVSVLRYFNPIGAHPSGLIGEDPRGIPNNLLPYVAQVAAGRLETVNVYGNDYPTPDGTGVRDYIHVVDLALAHIAALERAGKVKGLECFNVGTGRGYSVLEVIRAFETAWGSPIPYRIVGRRAGDVSACYADPTRAAQVLGWKAQYDLAKMCEDTARWQKQNPNGYPD